MSFLKPKYLIPIALISGFLASYGAYGYMQAKLAQAAKENNLKQVVVAANHCYAGQLLKEKDLAFQDFPVSLVPAGACTSRADLVGRALKSDITTSEIILESKLAPLGSSGGVISMIPPGMRAMTVSVNVVSGVGGFIIPNSSVDVMATINSSNSKSGIITKIILQDVKVLAIDQTYRKDDTEPITVKSVTLLVTPEQGEKLALASQEGQLQLVLRNQIDRQEYTSRGVKLDQLVKDPAPPRRTVRTYRSPPKTSAAPPKEENIPEERESKPRTVEMIRSNVRSEITLNPSND